MSSAKKLLEAAAGNAGGAGLDVAEVFSTFLYEGNGTARSITNGIDLAGEGGLVWLKSRSAGGDNYLIDTERGGDELLISNSTNASATVDDYPVGNGTRFDSTGFSIGPGGAINGANVTRASWTFRKAPKFFDIVTYTGTGGNQTISHNLGSVPGMIIIKRTDGANDWPVYHRGTNGGTNPEQYATFLNDTSAGIDGTYFNDTAPTSTQFTVGNYTSTNGNGDSYVAYLFAHNNNDGEFGPDGDQDIISCGSYTGNGSTPAGPIVDLGFEPQWLLIKNATAAANWYIYDTMRGWPVDSSVTTLLRPDTNDAELGGTWAANNISATGFQIRDDDSHFNTNGSTYIYMAIRAPMITPPEAATDVFAIDAEDSAAPYFRAGFPVDFEFYRTTSSSYSYYSSSRLMQGFEVELNASASQGGASAVNFDYMNGFSDSATGSSNVLSWMWKRAKGYMDVVCYTGNGSAQTVPHSLGVAPEMMWVKNRDQANGWPVYAAPLGATHYLILNSNGSANPYVGYWNDTAPTSSVFSLKNDGWVNNPTRTYVAYLFATLAGISKVGSVSHSGSSTDVDCGFSNGARFVLLKRTDASGDWYFWDSVRGIAAGNSPYLLLNSTAAQVTNTDYIDPLSSGFTITGDFTDGDYIFYAIA